MLERDHLTDGPAGRMADEVRRLDPERVHETQNVVRHLLHGVRDARVRALARAPVIVDDDVEVAGEIGDLGAPERALPGETRHQK